MTIIVPKNGEIAIGVLVISICKSIMPNDFQIRRDSTVGAGSGARDWIVRQQSCPELRRHGVEAVGITDLGPSYELIRPNPNFANIVVCCDGSLEFLINSQWQVAEAGAVLIAPHGVPHGLRTGRSGALTAWVAFAVLPQSYAQRGWDAHSTRLAGVKDHRPLLWAIQGLHTESTGARDPSAIAHWAELVVYASGRLADDRRSDNAAVLRPTWAAVDAELGNPWTAESIAELAGLSPSHFRRLCRERLGRSPSHHLAHLRMQRAAVLLTTTAHKLAGIAAAVGYDNTFAFSVAFKRWSGMAPAHYRANVDRPIART
ncbi:AraC family transcriptional regulator [soil metagenome]